MPAPNPPPRLFVGVMSGTSLDGVDAALCRIDEGQFTLLGFHGIPMPDELREMLHQLQAPSTNELDLCLRARKLLSELYAEAIGALLSRSHVEPSQIIAAGCHGQTLRHQPGAGYTLQILDGALLSELTGMDIVCDFRSRDIAAGGQGAPLVPAFHQAIFHHPAESRAIVNIGGMANITLLPAIGGVTGFDCGPGNVLMDEWIYKAQGAHYDPAGQWGAQGSPAPALLNRLLAHPFFETSPPKSCGREDFNLSWLEGELAGADISAADVQATLQALTAQAIADSIRRYGPGTRSIYICGGGARNVALMEKLAAALHEAEVNTTEAVGLAAECIEAAAFAWLAERHVAGAPGNLPAVTGASGPRILGALYPYK